MHRAEELLKEMDGILDLLIGNAKKLLDLSTQVISEEVLSPLQAEQQTLLDNLIEKDDSYHKIIDGTKPEGFAFMRERIDDKLDVFQQLNASFIDNITSTHGLIQFEKGKIQAKPKKIKTNDDV